MTTAALPTALRRLRAMDAAEIRFRAATALRNAVDRARVTVAPPAWDRKDLRLAGAQLEAARRMLLRGDALLAHAELARYFRQRRPRFPLAPGRLDEVAARIAGRFPDADVTSRADAVLAGHYDLLGYAGVVAGHPPDWHGDPVNGRRAPLLFWDAVPYLDPACGDHKIIWELNRHQHFLTLGRAYRLTRDDRYYQAFVRQLQSWIAANPPLQGVNWSSMLELAFRSMSWLWALHFFVDAAGDHDESPWLVDLLLAMDRQLLHVEHNLSRYFSPNTHFSGEGLALYVAGCVLPELGDAEHRASLGRTVLLSEAERQIHEDGGHAELSAHYHRYSTDFYLFAAHIARINRDPAAPLFEQSARRQAQYLRTLADDHGRLPLLGDDDGGQLFPICGREPADCRDSLAHAAVLLDDPALSVGPIPEETYWFCADHDDVAHYGAAQRPWPSRRFDDSGYCVSRNDRGDQLVFDCGPHGFLNGGHAHADALSVVLTVAGMPLLVDPGTATYTMDPEMRDRFRSTAMHNTLLVNGRPQAEPRGPFHWAAVASARCTAWTTRPGMDYAEGRHEAHAPITHARRVLALHGIGWVIVDHLFGGSGHVEATAMWHIHPSWSVDALDEQRVELRQASVRLGLASSAPLRRVDGPLAAFAPVYGRVETAPCIAAAAAGPLPLTLVTFVPAAAAWLPRGVVRTAEPDTFEIQAPGGALKVVSNAELEPVVEIIAGVAQTLHSGGRYRTTDDEQRSKDA